MRCRLGLLILLLLPAGRTLSPPELRTPGGAPAPYPTRRSAGLQHDFGTGDEGDESWRGVEKDRSMCIALRISLSLSFSLSFSLSLARALSHPFPPPTHTHTPHTPHPPTHTNTHSDKLDGVSFVPGDFPTLHDAVEQVLERQSKSVYGQRTVISVRAGSHLIPRRFREVACPGDWQYYLSHYPRYLNGKKSRARIPDDGAQPKTSAEVCSLV